MLKVGITGGIGSGKTTACRFFSELGRVVVSADQIARKLADTDESIRTQIRRLFGNRIYTKSGRLNRKLVAGMVFGNEGLRKKLNKIIHPGVLGVIHDQMRMFSKGNTEPYVLVEAALIFESRMDEWLDYTINVDADRELRIRRVMARDMITRRDVLERIRAQLPEAETLKRADFAINNDKSMKELFLRVRFIDALIAQMATVHQTSVQLKEWKGPGIRQVRKLGKTSRQLK